MEYIIVGSNNYWYGTWEQENPITRQKARIELKQIKTKIKANDYDTNEIPETLYLYEAKEIMQLN